MLVLADTNFLLYLTKYRLWDKLKEYYGSYELLVPAEVGYELHQIASSAEKAKERAAAAVTIECLEKLKVRLEPRPGNADEALLSTAKKLLALKKPFVVATQDKLLGKALKAKGAKLLKIRQKSYFIEA